MQCKEAACKKVKKLDIIEKKRHNKHIPGCMSMFKGAYAECVSDSMKGRV